MSLNKVEKIIGRRTKNSRVLDEKLNRQFPISLNREMFEVAYGEIENLFKVTGSVIITHLSLYNTDEVSTNSDFPSKVFATYFDGEIAILAEGSDLADVNEGSNHILDLTLGEALVLGGVAFEEPSENKLLISDCVISFTADKGAIGKYKWSLQYTPVNSGSKVEVIKHERSSNAILEPLVLVLKENVSIDVTAQPLWSDVVESMSGGFGRLELSGVIGEEDLNNGYALSEYLKLTGFSCAQLGEQTLVITLSDLFSEPITIPMLVTITDTGGICVVPLEATLIQPLEFNVGNAITPADVVTIVGGTEPFFFSINLNGNGYTAPIELAMNGTLFTPTCSELGHQGLLVKVTDSSPIPSESIAGIPDESYMQITDTENVCGG